jgi:hypothetical protein
MPEQTPEGPVPAQVPLPRIRLNRPVPWALHGPATAFIRTVACISISLCLTSVDMTKTVPLLASLVSLFLAGPVVAGDSRHLASDAPDTPSAADEKGTQAEPAECPIKKTIDGKTYCFQNDPS